MASCARFPRPRRARRRVGPGLGDPQAQPGCAELRPSARRPGARRRSPPARTGRRGRRPVPEIHRRVVEGCGSGRQWQRPGGCPSPTVRSRIRHWRMPRSQSYAPISGVDLQTLDEDLVQTIVSRCHDKTQVPPLESGLHSHRNRYHVLASGHCSPTCSARCPSPSCSAACSAPRSAPERLGQPRRHQHAAPGRQEAGRALTLLGDLLKGLLPVLLARLLELPRCSRPGSAWPRCSAISTRCTSSSAAARVSPRRPACCSASPADGPAGAGRLGC